MTALNGFAERWLDWAAAAAWQMALLVIALAVLSFLFRKSSARLRHGLWLLVLVKALLPPTLSAPWSLGGWAADPTDGWRASLQPASGGSANLSIDGANQAIDGDPRSDNVHAQLALATILFLAWAAGCLALWGAVGWRYVRLVRSIGSMRAVDEGPLCVELERLARQFSLGAAPELYATNQAMSPMLIGAWRPRIIIPEAMLASFDSSDVRLIIAHEVMHCRRRDVWVGWLQVFVQGVFWFHPLVWLANARIRHERECACDEAVLRGAPCDRQRYGQTIVHVLTAARGRSLAMSNMAGIFERGSQLQTRLEEIMSFDQDRRQFVWASRLVVLFIAIALLPMAAPAQQAARSDADAAAAADAPDEDAGASIAKDDKDGEGSPTSARPKTNWPTVVATTPELGVTDVDPALTEITVTFDRDMDVGGFSWTGGGAAYPQAPDGEQPVWKDKRTCVLPVQLRRGTFYRVGINSSSYQNFRSELGVPAETSAIYFATRGASRGVASRVREPKVVACTPELGADDVDPRLNLLTVTFDLPMDLGGLSFTGGGPSFPNIPEGQRPRWSRNGKTCTLPVELQPGTHYVLGLNSVSHKNFASRWGVPLAPVQFEFTTSGEQPAETAAAPPAQGKAPRIVRITPENGARDVDPTLAAIEVAFDRPMGPGFSWTGGGEQFPTIPAGQRPQWSADKKTCTLPVVLKPNWTYRLGLNSSSFQNFKSADGLPLEPVAYEFRTGGGEQ